MDVPAIAHNCNAIIIRMLFQPTTNLKFGINFDNYTVKIREFPNLTFERITMTETPSTFILFAGQPLQYQP
jgi:hypothetical protein